MPLDLPVMPGSDGIAFGDNHIGDAALAQRPRGRRALDAAADDDDVARVVAHRARSGDPVGARQRHPGHRGRLDGHRDQVLGLEVQHVGLAAGARDGLRLHGQHPQVVGQPAAALDRVEPRGQLGVLGADARRVGAVLEVVEEARGAAELLVLGGVAGMVVAQRDQRGGADRDRVGAQRQRLGDVGAGADAAGDDQLHLAVHSEFLQRLHGLRDGGQRRDADVLDEHLLGGGGAALHAVDHDDVGAGVHGELHVVVGAGGADLDVDRLLPVGDLAQLVDLDGQVVGAGPVRVPARRPLVDALGQRAHPRDAVGDLLAEQHSAAAGLGALAEHHLDRVGLAQVVGVHPVARRKVLVDQVFALPALLRRHAAVAGGGRRADLAGAAAERLLGGAGQRAERHAGDGDRDIKVQRVFGVPVAEHDVGVAAFAVALQRVARHRRAEEQQVVEVRQRPFGAPAADVVDAGFGGALDGGDGRPVEGGGLAQARGGPGRRWCSSSVARGVVDVEVVERRAPSRSGCRRRCRRLRNRLP